MSKLNDLNKFLETFLNKVAETGIDVSNYNLDHVAYQASSSEDYESIKPEFETISKLVHEALVGNRRVGVFELNNPMNYKGNTIIALEIIEPREGQVAESSWEHAEFVISEPYHELMAKYPKLSWDTSSVDRPIYSHLKFRLADNMQLKFHKMGILETIKLEEADK